MEKLLLFFILSLCSVHSAKSQPITVDDLVTLTSLSSRNIDNYLNKKGFVSSGKGQQGNPAGMTFIETQKTKSKDTSGILRSVMFYKEEEAEYYVLHTSSIQEYKDGEERLKKAGFYCDSSKGKAAPVVFKKKNITVTIQSLTDEGLPDYFFSLRKKEIPQPDDIRYAEDLLEFDSHEYLVSFFGQKNVTQDVYYFSEKELKKCSVLFPNTSRQVTFIWNDDSTLSKLSYILISGILPTAGAVQFSASVSQNKWNLKNGISCNMSLRELLELNGNDFEFYGRNSEFSYMVAPERKGNVDFKKIGITLGCFDCSSSSLLDQKKVSASDVVGNALAMYIVYIMIMP